MTLSFAGQTALITGASAGIGFEFAMQLHTAGANVICVARRGDKLNTLIGELNNRRGGSASAVVANLTNTQDLDTVARRLKEEKIDILVNNAGRGSFGPFEELSLAEELEMIDLNIRASVVLAHAAIPRWKKNGSGMLIGISSIAAMQPLPYMATYSATKAFNFNHTVALWAELRPFGIKALAVCPGPTETEFAGVARVPGTFSGAPRDPVATVVRHSLQAASLGLPFVVPGIRSWGLSILCRMCPTLLSTFLTERTLRKILPYR